ncbi:MAG: S-adenosylmethionine:tRNA ribosyltransferase-isomerase, partial [Thermodesulfobacteriota bacterium]|nr:S-adenosylmethionine:tRNA ribosyltransferase-isomerase [Thermodesulfobacteriota bacterium]
MLLKEFDYILPESFIAQYPIDTRHNSKLAVLRRSKQEVLHRQFFDIGEFLACGDVLVVNDTKVIPARLHGKKLTGGCIEVLLLEKIEADLWRCLAKPSRKLKPGMKIFFDDSLHGEITSRNGRGLYVKFSGSKDVFESIKRVGKTPLPLYIKREEEGFDSLRYQTIFAQKEGAIAAPTAGLHFTHDVLNTLKEKGVVVV